MRFLNNLDLVLNELQNVKGQILASDPGSPVEGQFWYNSTSKTIKFYTGSTTIVLGRLDQINQPTADVSMNSQKITSLGTPTAATDAATKGYVDGLSQGLAWKDSVRVATTAAGTLATDFENGDTVDGVTLATNDRILIKNQASGQENGIYTVNASGAPTRALDADSAAEVLQMAVFVEEGTANADTAWVCTTNAPITLNTTALTFVKFSSSGSGTVNKFSANVGNASATSIAITHNLGTRDVMVEVYKNSSSYDKVYPNIEHTDANTVTLIFSVAPGTDEFRCVVLG